MSGASAERDKLNVMEIFIYRILMGWDPAGVERC